jgi:hypothetical protein
MERSATPSRSIASAQGISARGTSARDRAGASSP